ncbi:conserved hypothetical protein [Xanthomonas euvesicatoria pv. vesicatoria str. 85-10]|nr:conserved hypothetical protein [Xanthomonas euvesicatoria pv. vesicatoria str. 85-10]
MQSISTWSSNAHGDTARMTHKTLRRTLIHGYCGEFRVETLESQAPGATLWLSTAFVYHRDRAAPVATIEGAGQGEYRGDAREQALRVGSCLAEFLDPKEYRSCERQSG